MPRKLPALNDDNCAFWQGGKSNALLIHYCHSCTQFFHPPGSVCPNCVSKDVYPRRVSGRGKIASFTINRQPWTPELNEPFVIAIVELEEQPGLRFVTNIEDVDVDEVFIGMPVRVRFRQEDDVWLPLFTKE
ncbi:Zn-ribbon domain-containing OB-fold protein [Marinobacter adhaerens]|uniref:Zn-ribbon domain-containing OB-fold protein n=1 Tax=Marinobacter adhaerens TaxID=1033846 RepID=A0ABX8IJ44_9GAMM|nr:Zn-ribbon domain-containing OB-fold protein [Marinobacter adhaerens]QWV13851.1 Zn-ribbon domain-containing OB-fold protein [Marinobacter adhaerens]